MQNWLLLAIVLLAVAYAVMEPSKMRTAVGVLLVLALVVLVVGMLYIWMTLRTIGKVVASAQMKNGVQVSGSVGAGVGVGAGAGAQQKESFRG